MEDIMNNIKYITLLSISIIIFSVSTIYIFSDMTCAETLRQETRQTYGVIENSASQASIAASDHIKINEVNDMIISGMSMQRVSANDNIIVPQRSELKYKLLEYYYRNSEKQVHNIQNIDSIVDSYIKYFSNLKNNDFVAQDFRLYPHTHYWHLSPYISGHSHWIAYGTSFIGIDCYRSSVAGEKSTTEEKTISYKLGATGSFEIKSFLDIGGSWEYSEEAKTIVSQGTTCPAWTVVWWRPYSRYEKTDYTGVYNTEYYDIWGNYHVESQAKYFANKVPVDELTEYQSKINTTHNPNASTPSPNTGCPNAWW